MTITTVRMYWPATRATFTTGREAPYVSATAICSRMRASGDQ